MQFISDDNDFSDTAVVHCPDARPQLRLTIPMNRSAGFVARFVTAHAAFAADSPFAWHGWTKALLSATTT